MTMASGSCGEGIKQCSEKKPCNKYKCVILEVSDR